MSKVNFASFPQNKRNALSVIDLNMRTTSSVESINSAIQRSFPDTTNIFKFIDSLKMYESIKSYDLHQLSLGEMSNNQLERKRKIDKERQEKIKYLTRKLQIGEITVAAFLESMSSKDVLPSIGVYAFLIEIITESHNAFTVILAAYKEIRPKRKPSSMSSKENLLDRPSTSSAAISSTKKRKIDSEECSSVRPTEEKSRTMKIPSTRRSTRQRSNNKKK